MYWHWYLVHGKDTYEVVTDHYKKGVWYLFKNKHLWFGIALSATEGQRMCEAEARSPRLRSRNKREFWEKTVDTIPDTVYNMADWSKRGSRVAYQILTKTEADDSMSSAEIKEKVMAVLTKSKPAAPVSRGPAARPATAPAASKAPARPAPAAAVQRGAVAAPAEKTAPEQRVPKPPKQQISANQAEIEAAIEGTLEPREVKGTTAQDGLGGAQDRRGSPIGRPIGLTTGLPIQMAWIYVFQCNEDNAKAGTPWTDEEISAWMKEEFPGRPNKTFDAVASARNACNKGTATRGIPLKHQFSRYNADGTIYVPKKSNFGRPAAEEGTEVEQEAPAAAAPPKKPVAKKIVKT